MRTVTPVPERGCSPFSLSYTCTVTTAVVMTTSCANWMYDRHDIGSRPLQSDGARDELTASNVGVRYGADTPLPQAARATASANGITIRIMGHLRAAGAAPLGVPRPAGRVKPA